MYMHYQKSLINNGQVTATKVFCFRLSLCFLLFYKDFNAFFDLVYFQLVNVN